MEFALPDRPPSGGPGVRNANPILGSARIESQKGAGARLGSIARRGAFRRSGRLDVDEDEQLGAVGTVPGIRRFRNPLLFWRMPGWMPAEIKSVWPTCQSLIVWLSRVSTTSGTSIESSRGSDLARGDHAGPVQALDGIGREVDGGVEGVAVEGQQGAELECDAFLELLGLGLEAEARRRSRAACRRCSRAAPSRLDREGLAVDHLQLLLRQEPEALEELHLGQDESAAFLSSSVQIC